MAETVEKVRAQRTRRARWTLTLSVAIWPFVSLSLFPFCLLGSLVTWPVVSNMRRRNRGDDDVLQVAEEVGFVWIPTVSVLASLGIGIGLDPSVRFHWLWAVIACASTPVMTYVLARQVARHAAGDATYVYARNTDPKRALATLRRTDEVVERWLPLTAQTAFEDGDSGAIRSAAEAKLGTASSNPSPIPSMSRIVRQVARSLPQDVGWFAIPIGLWCALISYGWFGSSNMDRAWPSYTYVALSMLGGLPALAVFTYLTDCSEQYQRTARTLVLSERAAKRPPALATRTNYVQRNPRSLMRRIRRRTGATHVPSITSVGRMTTNEWRSPSADRHADENRP